MNLTTLTDLVLQELAGLYDAEQQLVGALPLLAEKAFTEELREAFTLHGEQTKKHVQRLESAFKLLKTPPSRKACHGMQGLLKDAESLLQEDNSSDPDVLDASLICTAQYVEHFEIAAYGCVSSHARLLGAVEVAKLLEETLREEKETDRLLTELAEGAVNFDAAETDEELQRPAADEDDAETAKKASKSPAPKKAKAARQ